METSKKMSIINYYGGKFKMIDKFSPEVIEVIKTKKRFIEPFMGSASMTVNLAYLLGEDNCRHIEKHINDADRDVFMLFKVLADHEKAQEFLKRLQRVKYCQQEYIVAKSDKAARYYIERGKRMDEIDIAIDAYILYMMSYNACKKTFAPRKGSWFENRKISLEQAMRALEGVKVTNEDAFDIIRQYKDDEESFTFVDSPYYIQYRSVEAYEKEMSGRGPHRRLCCCVSEAKGAMVLCGYRAPDNSKQHNIYDEILSESGCNQWYYSKVGNFFKGSARQKGKSTPIGTEYIWHNFPIEGSKKL